MPGMNLVLVSLLLELGRKTFGKYEASCLYALHSSLDMDSDTGVELEGVEYVQYVQTDLSESCVCAPDSSPRGLANRRYLAAAGNVILQCREGG